jgi:hypothetical protein
VGLSTSKKKECAPNEQARAKSNSAQLQVGRIFFEKKEVKRVKSLRLFSLETSRNQGFSEINAGCKKTGPNHTNCASLVSIG